MLGVHFSAHGSSDCLSKMKILLHHDSKKKQDSKDFLNSPFSKDHLDYFDEELKLLEFSFIERSMTIRTLEKLEGKKINYRTLMAYLLFLRSLPEKKRSSAILEILFIVDEIYETPHAKKFLKLQGSVQEEEMKAFQRKMLELQKNENISVSDMMIHAQLYAKNHGKEYEKILYSCRTPSWTKHRTKAARQYTKFLVGIGLTSSLLAYTSQNYDKEKDFEWFGKIGYELTFSVVAGTLSSKIISDPNTSIYMKSIYKYLLARLNGSVDTVLYSKFFGISKKEGQRRIQKILENLEVEQDVSALVAFLEKERFYEKFKKTFFLTIEKFYKESEPSFEARDALKKMNIDWSHITKEDLKRDDVQNILIAASLAKNYDENMGGFVQTGHIGLDRWSFNALYGMASLPKSMIISLYIYNTLCKGSLTPAASLFKAIGIYTLDSLIFDQLYFYARRKGINQ